MKHKILAAVGIFASLLVVASPLSAYAAVDHVVMDSLVGEFSTGTIAAYGHYMDGSTEVNYYGVPVDLSGVSTEPQLINAANAAVASFATSQGYPLTNGIIWPYTTTDQVNAAIAAATSTLGAPPMIVSGVAKSNTYAVTGAPAVAGGSGVARFYIDSNGDGTGTAPSEVETDSLSATVWNTAASYLPEAFTVDTNRKYIDITEGKLNFSTGLAGLLNVLTGATIGAAANGTVVHAFVIVKK